MITELARAWLLAMIASGAIALVAAIAARVYRRHDAALWHAVWTAIAAASTVAPIAALVLPTVFVIWRATPALPGFAVPVLPDRLLELLVSGYALGAIVMAVRLGAGVLLIRDLRRRCVRIDRQWLEDLRSFSGIEVRRCRLNPRITSPITIGWRDPIVVLPASAMSWPLPRLRAVLCHEFAHIERRDYLWNLWAATFLVIYWPSPMAWWLVRRARLDSEFACDRVASSEVGDAAYAQVLVQNAREFIAGGQSLGVVAPGADTDLFVRVDALLNGSTLAQPASGWVTRLVVMAVATVIVGASVVRVISNAGGVDDHWQRHAIHHDGH